MRRLTHLVILAGFVFSLGGHWYLLQGLAWVNMVRDYSQVVPFTQAVSMTLSGQYPCPLCRAIAEKKNSTQEKILAFDKYDKKFCLPTAARPVARSSAPTVYSDFVTILRVRHDSPPTPPPRRVLA